MKNRGWRVVGRGQKTDERGRKTGNRIVTELGLLDENK